MKKMLVLATLIAFAAPGFAGGQQDEKEGPKPFKGPRHEMMQKDPAFKEKMEAKKAEHKARKAQIKARDAKLEKLVQEYKKAKDGSKKQAAAREEIGQILAEVRDEQITIRERQIKSFEERLGDMKNRLDKEKSPEMKKEWIEKMTDRVITEDGDLEEVLAHYGHMGKGNPKGFDGGSHFKGHPKKGPVADILPVPPAPQEEK